MNKLNKIEGELPAGRYDSHVHVFPGRPDPEGYVKRLAEAGFDIPGLRFCCAHISWPWCEECVAVYGKFLNALTRSDRPRGELPCDGCAWVKVSPTGVVQWPLHSRQGGP